MKQLTGFFLDKKLSGITKTLLITSIFVGFLQSCNGSHKKQSAESDFDPNSFTTIDMRIDDDFSNSFLSDLPDPEYIVLQESDSIMMSGLSKLVAKNNKFFVLDSWNAKTAVSFDQKGNPLTKYGRVGQGPGEYFRPIDLWVKDSIVYILDDNQKKVIRYHENGRFISESSIPFYAEGFAVLPDNGFIFSISPDGKNGPRICVTDSTIDNKKYLLNAPDGFVGGKGTSNMFQETKQGISYYKAPLDTMYYFDNSGNITGGLVFDFGEKSLPDHAKLDYVAAWENKELKNSNYLTNNPFILSDKIFFSTSMDEGYYNCIYDKGNNKFGGKEFASENVPFLLSSINAVDENNNLIGFTTNDFVEKLDSKFMPSDSIMKLLEDNPFMILKYHFPKK